MTLRSDIRAGARAPAVLVAALASLLACGAVGAEATTATASAAAIAEVPDPYGLGERLALIDWLHEHAIATPEAAGVEDLRRLYAQAVAPKAEPPSEAEAQRRDEIVRALWKRHTVVADAEEGTDDLDARLKRLDAEFEATQAKYRELASADEGDVVDERRPMESAAPVKAEKPKAKAEAEPKAAAGLPPVDEEHRAEWLNYGSEPNSTKDGVQLWVHIRKGDRAHYYVTAHSRRTGQATVQFTIDGQSGSVTVQPGRTLVPTQVATSEVRSLPLIVVNSAK